MKLGGVAQLTPHSLVPKSPGAYWPQWLPGRLPKANAGSAPEERAAAPPTEHNEGREHSSPQGKQSNFIKRKLLALFSSGCMRQLHMRETQPNWNPWNLPRCFLSLEGLRKGFCGCKEGFFPPSSLRSNVISSLDFWAESLHSNNMCFNWLQLLNPLAYEHMVQDITDPWNGKFNHSSLLMQETWQRHWEEEWWGAYAQFAYNRL